jgi:hypothetical protein
MGALEKFEKSGFAADPSLLRGAARGRQSVDKEKAVVRPTA